MGTDPEAPHIGTLGEKSLHAALKAWYGQPGDQVEVRVEGYVIDLVRGEVLVEIQTGNFSALASKLSRLLASHRVHLVHPIPKEKWIVRQREDGAAVRRRKSPRRGQVLDIFRELVYIPGLIPHPHFSLEVLLTQEEEIWRDDGRGSWRRRGWSLHDRQLLDVVGQARFDGLQDYLALLPAELPTPFTNAELAEALECRPPLAGKVTYTLRKAGALAVTGRRANAHLHEVV